MGKKSLENVGYRKVYQPKTNKAIQCLNHLLIFKILDSIEWEQVPSSKNSEVYEIVKVRIKGPAQTATDSTAPPLGGLDLVYERERPIQMATRQGIKHHIALTAIRKIVGPDELWTKLNTSLSKLSRCCQTALR